MNTTESLPVPLLLYVRKDCSLCDEAKALLLAVARHRRIPVWEVDADTAPALAARYGNDVPVALYRGRELFRLMYDEKAVLAALSAPQGQG